MWRTIPYLTLCLWLAGLLAPQASAQFLGTPPIQPAYLQRQNLAAPANEPSTSIFLTFDDGPTPGVTTGIGDVLDRYGAFGNFFVIGSRAQTASGQETLARLASQGHLVANHTFDHAMSYSTEATLEASLRAATRVIEPHLPASGLIFFRSPGGVWNSTRTRWLNISRTGGPDEEFATYVGPIFWNVGGQIVRRDGRAVDMADWQCWSNGISVADCAAGYINKIRANQAAGKASIVLMHDLRPQSVELVDQVVRALFIDPVPYEFKRLDMTTWPFGWQNL